MKQILANFPLSQHKDLNAHDLCKELPSLTKERGKKKKLGEGEKSQEKKMGSSFIILILDYSRYLCWAA